MFETMVDHGRKILAELGVEVGKVSSMGESVVVPSFFLEKYSAKNKTKQKKRDLISQLDGSQIAGGIRRVHLSTGHRFTGHYHIAF